MKLDRTTYAALANVNRKEAVFFPVSHHAFIHEVCRKGVNLLSPACVSAGWLMTDDIRIVCGKHKHDGFFVAGMPFLSQEGRATRTYEIKQDMWIKVVDYHDVSGTIPNLVEKLRQEYPYSMLDRISGIGISAQGTPTLFELDDPLGEDVCRTLTSDEIRRFNGRAST